MSTQLDLREFVADAQDWRRDIHAHPELLYDVQRTAKLVADRLQSFGCDQVKMFVGKSGVVGVIKGRKPGGSRVIGLRADMDALPIHEQTNLPYRSQTEGKMHACGHDGHTAMLLGRRPISGQNERFCGNGGRNLSARRRRRGWGKGHDRRRIDGKFRHPGSIRDAQHAELASRSLRLA